MDASDIFGLVAGGLATIHLIYYSIHEVWAWFQRRDRSLISK
jgi:hypothetical protein